MAKTVATFIHPETGLRRKAPIGFSWTIFFFSFWAIVFRGGYNKTSFIAILLMLATCGFAGFVYMFIFNKQYATALIEAGYKLEHPGKISEGEVKSILGL